jgi:hypothetical protein
VIFGENDRSEAQNGSGVEHRHFDFDLLGLFHEVRQLPEGHVQHEADFTDLAHSNVKTVEAPGMKFQGFGK